MLIFCDRAGIASRSFFGWSSSGFLSRCGGGFWVLLSLVFILRSTRDRRLVKNENTLIYRDKEKRGMLLTRMARPGNVFHSVLQFRRGEKSERKRETATAEAVVTSK